MCVVLNSDFVVLRLSFALGRIRVTRTTLHAVPYMAAAERLNVHPVREAPASLKGMWVIMSLGQIRALVRVFLLSSSIWMDLPLSILLLPRSTQVRSR